MITSIITTKNTGETKKMFGYTARHLIITTETESSPDACTPMKKMKMVTDGWYIDAAFALDCDYGARAGYGVNAGSGGCQDRYNVKQIGAATKRGYPVLEKMTMYDENGKESFSATNEVVELSNATLDQALFEIPKDWREVKDSSAMYASMSSTGSNSVSYNSSNQNSSVGSSSMSSTLSKMNSPGSENNSTSSTLEAKKAGTIRVGLATVKTGAVGEGLNAAELAAAIQNSLPQYLKGTRVEIVNLEAKLASALESEAKEKECDYVLNTTVSHKKGGGFGMFGKALGGAVAQTGGAWGNTAADVAGAVAVNAVNAATVSQNVKSKDEITLDIKLTKAGAQTLAKQFKAKGDGDDIITPVVEQAAQAVLDAAGGE